MRLDLKQWRELASPIFDVHPREPEADASVDIDINTSNDLLLSKIASPAQLLVHDPAARTDICHDYLLFERFLSGGGHGQVADTGFDIAPSHLHLIDMSQHYQTLQQRSQSRGIFIPHAAIGYVRGEEPVLTSVELNSPQGRLLAAAHAEMLAALERDNEDSATLLVQTFLELVSRLMLSRGIRQSTTQNQDLPLKLLLRDFVSANLHRPDLDMGMLTSAFGVSRATIYRHFDEDGGIVRHIRNRRLDRCFLELAKTKRERGRVAAVARRWHFTDATHFSRLFRERFGMSPSRIFSSRAQPGFTAPSEQIRVLQDWLDRFRRS